MTIPRTARTSTTAAWVLYVLQMIGSTGLVAMTALVAVFSTDSCGSVEDEPALCDTDYLGAVVLGYWIVLAVLLVVVPIAIVRASRRGRATWQAAAGGLAAVAIASGGFVMLMSR